MGDSTVRLWGGGGLTVNEYKCSLNSSSSMRCAHVHAKLDISYFSVFAYIQYTRMKKLSVSFAFDDGVHSVMCISHQTRTWYIS